MFRAVPLFLTSAYDEARAKRSLTPGARLFFCASSLLSLIDFNCANDSDLLLSLNGGNLS